MSYKIPRKIILFILVTFLLFLGLAYYWYYFATLESFKNTYHIQGQTDQVAHPEIVSDNENNLYVIWEEKSNNNGTSESIDKIYLKKYDNRGISNDTGVILVKSVGLSNSKFTLDSNNNLHLIWFDLRDCENQPQNLSQNGYLYYKKFDTNLQILVNDKKVINQSFELWSENRVGVESISTLIIDNDNNLHIMSSIGYFYLDNDGNIILKDILFQEKAPLHVRSFMATDGMGNVFMVWDEHDEKVHFRGISINNKSKLVKIDNTILDDRKYVWEPKIIFLKDEFVAYWYYSPESGTTQIEIWRLDYNGSILEKKKLPIGSLIISNDKSYIHLIQCKGDSFSGDDLELFYYKYNINGEKIIDKTRILRIIRNPKYDHGPSAFQVKGLSDKSDNISMVWYINDGINGYQVHIFKLDQNRNALFSLKVVAP